MFIGHHFPHLRKSRKGLSLPDGLVPFDQVQASERQDEEAAVDQITVTAWLLEKTGHSITRPLQCSKTTGRSDRRKGCPAAMLLVKGKFSTDIQITYAIAVRKAECLFILDVLRDALEPSAGLSIFASVHQRHVPRVSFLLMNLHLVGGHVES